MGDLLKLPNIGYIFENHLIEVGISSLYDLKNIGNKGAWMKIKAIDDSACIHGLFAFEGEIRRIRKKELSPDTKNDLKEFYNLYK